EPVEAEVAALVSGDSAGVRGARIVHRLREREVARQLRARVDVRQVEAAVERVAAAPARVAEQAPGLLACMLAKAVLRERRGAEVAVGNAIVAGQRGLRTRVAVAADFGAQAGAGRVVAGRGDEVHRAAERRGSVFERVGA